MARQRNKALLQRLGRRMAQARTARGWTQEQLAEEIDVDPVSISRYETGARALSLSTLATVANALGLGLNELLDSKCDLPVPKHTPEAEELIRIFGTLEPTRRDLILRLAREFAAGQ